jgi:hypothetical protein
MRVNNWTFAIKTCIVKLKEWEIFTKDWIFRKSIGGKIKKVYREYDYPLEPTWRKL